MSSVREITSPFPFMTGWYNMMMFERGEEIHQMSKRDGMFNVLMMFFTCIAYIHNVFIALFVFCSYFIFKEIMTNVIQRKREEKSPKKERKF